MVDHAEAWAGWAEELRPPPHTFLPIELFYDNVREQKGQAAAAFAAIKDATKRRKQCKK